MITSLMDFRKLASAWISVFPDTRSEDTKGKRAARRGPGRNEMKD